METVKNIEYDGSSEVSDENSEFEEEGEESTDEMEV